jgi:acyl-CoA oxidase
MIARVSAATRSLRLGARALSTTTFDHADFSDKFLAEVQGKLPLATDPAKSAALLRQVVKSEQLMLTDMRDSPEKFFMAHRLLASVGLSGFGVRFTVQYNLFAGSILGLGGPEQIDMLADFQREGQLGCFLLTEAQAGVLSGLIVETTAVWNSDTQDFTLHTPSDKAAKNWISQGYTAELGVVIADLQVHGKSHGPHVFFMQLRNEGGALCPGIRIEDMGTKTVANDLDNARVWFDNVKLPKDALLNRFADIQDDAYVQVGDIPMRIEVIGQRLLTGRLAIAEAALVTARVLHDKCASYAETKVCNGLAGETTLAAMPQLRAVFEESERALGEMERFSAGVEQRLNACLRTGAIPDADLVEAISVCKIRAIEVAVERCHVLRLEVGSFALMHGSGFELVDMLLCCKFAEGDSRILQQKIARDRLKQLQKGGAVGAITGLFASPDAAAEQLAAISLARKLAPAGRDLEKMAAAMDANWREVYALADLVCARHVREGSGTGPGFEFPEGPPVEQLWPQATAFDEAWKEKL